ncbi:MAG: chromosomal replication initiator protein DnaA [Endomicrobia bacterium]|nr:chromosomal replication initiator protein DnaA [Endomicrobiia bacterium]
MSVSIVELWQKVVDNINLSVSQETYNLWIAPLKPLNLENNIFTVAVPNVYFSQWIETHHKKNIEQFLTDVLAQQTSLEFKPQQDLKPIIAQVENTPAPADVPQVQSVQKDQINPKYVFDRFVVGSSNRFAHACAESVAKNPGKQFNPLFIYGGVGLGKTHLLHAIGNYIKQSNPNLRVLYTTTEKFTSEFIDFLRFDKMPEFHKKYRSLDCLLIDDIQFLGGKGKSQEEFHNMFNTLHTSGKQIVVSSDRPPKELENIEERLISRFEWGVAADIQAPDLETRIAILRKKAEDEKFYVPDDVLLYIATHIKSNIRELEGSLLRITAFAAFTGTPLTVDSVQKILKDIIKQTDVRITIEQIQKVIAQDFNMDLRDMRSKRRTDAIAFPRQIAMYLARTLSDEFSTNDIGEAFGGRDHTTVMHACKKISEKVNSDPYFNTKINQLIKKIRESSDN